MHTQMEQLHKMITVFDHLNKDFQSNPPDTIKTAIANGMLILISRTQNLPNHIQL